MRSRRRVVALLAVLVLAGLGYGALRPATHRPGAHFNRGTNAAWLGIEWVNEAQAEGEIQALAADLQQRQIRTVYVYTSYLRPSGQFGPTFAHAATAIPTLKRAYPQVNVQAWLGLPLRRPGPFASGYVVLDPPTRAMIAQFCRDLVGQHGFDGVHLDPEPILSGDAEVLALLDQVRAALGPGPTLSIATRRIWPLWPSLSWPLVGVWAWRGDYYREVARRVDQVALMTYDSGLPQPLLYRWWGRGQVVALTQALDGLDAEVFIGLPTSEEATRTHRPQAENMTSGLLGLVDGLNDQAARPDVLSGVAIYPYWETDEAEWAAYETAWLGQ